MASNGLALCLVGGAAPAARERHGQGQRQRRLRQHALGARAAQGPSQASAHAAGASSCPSADYPRSLRDVLPDPADRQHLTRIYFERVHAGKSPYVYYNLLQHLASSQADERTWTVLRKVRARVAEVFGDGFDIINDFYSFRSQSKRIFQNWHQDIEFWLTGASCSGFNLWVLLDHERMNYSFDVYDVHANRDNYDKLYTSRFGSANLTTTRPLFSPAEFERRSQHGGSFAFETRMPLRRARPTARGAAANAHSHRGRSAASVAGHAARPGSAGHAARRSSAALPSTARYTNVPLEVGDALVVRQVEIHRTDTHVVDSRQWRLALGFKILPRDRPIVREVTRSSPFGYDYSIMKTRWPALLPPLSVGRSLGDLNFYERQRLATPGTLHEAAWSVDHALDRLAANPVVVPAVGMLLLLLVSWRVGRKR